MNKTPAKCRSDAIVCGLLAIVTLALYWPVTQHAFIDFDDDDYITDNAMVKAGLTWPGVVWAFTNTEAANWHPLTWLSHMLDCQLFGLNPGAHHLVNVLFHAANALLLFAFLRNTTGALWRSAFVAALFAWHPLRVESVAWAAERKDVLCAFFWLLTLLAYARYANGIKDKLAGAWRDYTLALVLFALALLSKPMAVTLPFVLLLLDIWPLHRLNLTSLKVSLKPLLLEKLPFLALSLAASSVTYLARKAGGAVSPVGFTIRWMNAAEAYPRYIFEMVFPMNLSVVYPYRQEWPMTAVAGALVLLVAISILAIRFFRQTPWFFVGWFWFLGTMIPVIGLVQVGAASMADRYTYLPEIGLAIIIAWAAEMRFARPAVAKDIIVPAAAATATLVTCLAVSAVQIRYWRDSISLFLHAIAVTQNNYVADNALGKAFERSSQPEKALMLYREAVRIEPGYSVSQFNLATELMSFGQRDAALPHFQAAAKIDPQNPAFQFDLGLCWLQSDQPAAAAECFKIALRLKPDLAPAQFYLAEALARLGQANEALPHYREALRLDPNNAIARTALEHLLSAHPELH